jgi:hypothetical protein
MCVCACVCACVCRCMHVCACVCLNAFMLEHEQATQATQYHHYDTKAYQSISKHYQ